MAKLAAKKKPNKPAAPKKPTSRSKTGNAECSQAASNWQLSIRGKATLNPGTYQTLAKCRALSKSGQMADAQGRTGKLSDQGSAALKGRLQKRFDSGLITQKSRQDRLETLLKQRSQRGKVATPKLAQAATLPQRPGFLFDPGKSKAQTIVDSARSNPKYQQNRLRAKVNQNRVKSEIESNPTSMGVFRGSQRSKNAVYSGKLGLNSRKQREARLSGTKKELAEKRSEREYYANATPAKPTPARYSLGGKLAPGRGKDAPEYRDRLLKTLTKTQDRARNYELGRVDNPRVPIRTYIERGKELRLGTVANLRNAYNAETSKYVDQLHAQGRSASESVAVPKNTAQKITAEAQKRAKKETAERNENLESLKAGAIPLRWKVDGPKGFENIIIPSAEKNSMVVSAKPVGKGGRVAVQYLEEKGSYSALDVQGGYKLGGKMSMKGATRYGRAADYLLARAERKTGKKLAFSDLGKNKELKPYFQTLRNIQSLPRLTY